jgi:hypothetical protein
MSDNGMRLCLEHRPVLDDPDDALMLYPNTIGPCDYPLDGLWTARMEPTR